MDSVRFLANARSQSASDVLQDHCSALVPSPVVSKSLNNHRDEGNRLTPAGAGNVQMRVFLLDIWCSRSAHLPSSLSHGLLPLGCRSGKVQCSR